MHLSNKGHLSYSLPYSHAETAVLAIVQIRCCQRSKTQVPVCLFVVSGEWGGLRGKGMPFQAEGEEHNRPSSRSSASRCELCPDQVIIGCCHCCLDKHIRNKKRHQDPL